MVERVVLATAVVVEMGELVALAALAAEGALPVADKGERDTVLVRAGASDIAEVAAEAVASDMADMADMAEVAAEAVLDRQPVVGHMVLKMVTVLVRRLAAEIKEMAVQKDVQVDHS